MFRPLKGRGLHGMELVVSDDQRELVAAVKRHVQGASWQRCQVHFDRGLVGMVSHSERAQLGAGLRVVFRASTLQDARLQEEALAAQRRSTRPRVHAQIEEHSEEGFARFGSPPADKVKIHSTNGRERFMEEIKRPTLVIPNREPCLRLATALCAKQSDDWINGKRYLDISELRQWQRDHERKEVVLTTGLIEDAGVGRLYGRFSA